ncbi:WhiB family transcriptional regulator [Solicola sp. PLA-1-18]|uniref:WhiB family transcriptional regulator n=1 Tax=Solicola sp. PLA-1-18 TaxID=3380532 RepID=UPI003B80B768
MTVERLPLPLQENWEWQYEAACSGMDSACFFAPATERGPKRDAREDAAKAVCATCPVIEQCLEHAMRVREPFGVWGGMTASEREAARRGRSRVRLRDSA